MTTNCPYSSSFNAHYTVERILADKNNFEWTEPSLTVTKRGLYNVYEGKFPTDPMVSKCFSVVWGNNKQALKDAGLTISKDEKTSKYKIKAYVPAPPKMIESTNLPDWIPKF